MLTSIYIPSGVTSIDSYAFFECNGLKSVTFGKNSQLGSIGKDAFGRCYNLTKIVIPSGVTTMGSEVFYECSKLTIYCEAETRPSGWSWSWNADCRVHWGYVEE